MPSYLFPLAACLFAVTPPADPMPDGAVAVLGGVTLRPESQIASLAFSSDGKSLVTLGHDLLVQEWDRASGRERRRVVMKPGGSSRAAQLSADAKTVAAVVVDGSLCVFDAESGKQKQVLGGPDAANVHALSLSSDGRTLVTANGSVVAVWDASNGKAGPRIEGVAGVAAVAITPDGKHFVLARPDHSLRLVDSATGKEVRTLEPAATTRGPGFAGNPARLTVSPDGKLLAYSANDPTVTLYSLETGKVVTRLHQQLGGGWLGVAFSPNGRFLAIGGYPGVRVYGILSGRELRLLDTQPPTNIFLLAIAPDGRTLAAAGQDTSLRLWDIVEGHTLHAPAGHSANVLKMTFLEGGKSLVTYGADGRLLCWDLATSRETAEQRGMPFNGGWLVTTADRKGVQMYGQDANLHVWRPGEGVEKERLTLPGPRNFRQALAPAAKFLAVFGADNKLRLYDLRSKEPQEHLLDLPTQAAWTNHMVFSDDGRRLVTAGGDGVLRVWDCAGGRLVKAFDGSKPDAPRLNYASQLQLSADGRCLLLYDGELRLVEIASGQIRAQTANRPNGLHSLALSPDGRLAARGNIDGTVMLYETAGGKELAQRKGRLGMVTSMAFSEDSQLLASGGMNGAVVVWKMPQRPPTTTTLSEAQRAALWRQLADADAPSAAHAIESLVAAPGPAVELLREHLRPHGKRADIKRLEKLIAELDHDSFAVREKASRELADAGAAAEGVLRKALDKDSEEVRRRAQELLDRLEASGSLPERFRGVRAVEALERIGTAAARQALSELAKDSADSPLREEIAASLERLENRR
jgi:WD40 repeat protein